MSFVPIKTNPLVPKKGFAIIPLSFTKAVCDAMVSILSGNPSMHVIPQDLAVPLEQRYNQETGSTTPATIPLMVHLMTHVRRDVASAVYAGTREVDATESLSGDRQVRENRVRLQPQYVEPVFSGEHSFDAARSALFCDTTRHILNLRRGRQTEEKTILEAAAHLLGPGVSVNQQTGYLTPADPRVQGAYNSARRWDRCRYMDLLIAAILPPPLPTGGSEDQGAAIRAFELVPGAHPTVTYLRTSILTPGSGGGYHCFGPRPRFFGRVPRRDMKNVTWGGGEIDEARAYEFVDSLGSWLDPWLPSEKTGVPAPANGSSTLADSRAGTGWDLLIAMLFQLRWDRMLERPFSDWTTLADDIAQARLRPEWWKAWAERDVTARRMLVFAMQAPLVVLGLWYELITGPILGAYLREYASGPVLDQFEKHARELLTKLPVDPVLAKILRPYQVTPADTPWGVNPTVTLPPELIAHLLPEGAQITEDGLPITMTKLDVRRLIEKFSRIFEMCEGLHRLYKAPGVSKEFGLEEAHLKVGSWLGWVPLLSNKGPALPAGTSNLPVIELFTSGTSDRAYDLTSFRRVLAIPSEDARRAFSMMPVVPIEQMPRPVILKTSQRGASYVEVKERFNPLEWIGVGSDDLDAGEYVDYVSLTPLNIALLGGWLNETGMGERLQPLIDEVAAYPGVWRHLLVLRGDKGTLVLEPATGPDGAPFTRAAKWGGARAINLHLQMVPQSWVPSRVVLLEGELITHRSPVETQGYTTIERPAPRSTLFAMAEATARFWGDNVAPSGPGAPVT